MTGYNVLDTELLRLYYAIEDDVYNKKNCIVHSDYWEDLGVGGRITLRRTLGR
jgi:hypothetical protein